MAERAKSKAEQALEELSRVDEPRERYSSKFNLFPSAAPLVGFLEKLSKTQDDEVKPELFRWWSPTFDTPQKFDRTPEDEGDE